MKLALLFLSAGWFAGASVFAESSSADPIVGKWHWGKMTKEFRGDGAALPNGTWKCVNPNETPRRYVIKWDNGKWIDTVEMRNNDTKLVGHNQIGHGISGQRAGSPDTVLVPQTTAASQIELVTKIGVSTNSAVLAPVNVSYRDIRPDLIALRDNLRDEAVEKPVAGAAAYQAAVRLCDAWLSALAEREVRRRSFGATAPAVRDLEHAKKTTLRFWDDLLTFDREVNDARAKRSTDQQKEAFFTDAQKNNWNVRAAALRPGLEGLYAQFREARRQSAPPNR